MESSKKALVVAAAVLMSACATPPRQALQADVKGQIKKLAIVEVPDPERYTLYPGQSPAGFALYLFGALGGALLGGIEASRMESATTEFTTALKPHAPALGSHWTQEISGALSGRGYAATVVAPLPAPKSGQPVDCGDVKGQYDAVLVTTLAAGYGVDKQVEPQVLVRTQLLSSDCSKTLFSDTYVYGSRELKGSTLIERRADFAYPSREQLIAEPAKAREALRTGASEIAQRVAQAL